jgi:acyl carrier protein
MLLNRMNAPKLCKKKLLNSLGRDSDAPSADEPLYGTETGFDSFSLLEFILRLEDEFGIAIPDEDLDPDIFRSINTVVAYVLRRIEEKETP